MALFFTAFSSQRVTIPRDAGLDDHAEWSVLVDLYPTLATTTARADLWKKAHAKRLGFDVGDGLLVIKQNYESGVIQYAGQAYTNANQWYCACGAVNTSRAFLYSGDFAGDLVELSYSETTASQSGAIITDVEDEQFGYPGDVILGNESGRFRFERGFFGGIARVRWWSTPLTLGEFRLEYRSLWAVRQADLLGDYHVGWDGNERVIDRSGNGRHGSVVGF